MKRKEKEERISLVFEAKIRLTAYRQFAIRTLCELVVGISKISEIHLQKDIWRPIDWSVDSDYDLGEPVDNLE